MSKATDIREEAKARIVAADFADTVIRGQRKFNDDELPAVAIYPSPRTVRAESGTKYAMEAQITIEYIKTKPVATGDDDTDTDAIDDQADAMLAEVRDAMEVEPRQFGNGEPSTRILTKPGLSFESDEIDYPEDSGGNIAVRVVYSVPHIDDHG